MTQLSSLGVPDSVTQSGLLSISYVNDSDQVMIEGFGLSIDALAAVTPVAGPETAGLWMVGLVVVGALRRDQSRRSARA